MNPRILVNSQETEAVSILDRGLLYGDGVFRTLRLRAGEPVWWREHLHKLNQDCIRLDLPVFDPDIWLTDLRRCAGSSREAIIKLIVTRGCGARGYRAERWPEATRIVTVTEAPTSGVPAQDVQVRLCNLRLGHQPALAGIKHLNRLENVLAQSEWHDPAIHEGLLFDQSGHLVSGTKSNVFLVKGGAMVTPSLLLCGVAGVTRARLLEISRKSGIPSDEVDDLTLADVLDADEILLCNSLIGLWRVARLEARVWESPVLFPYLLERLHA